MKQPFLCTLHNKENSILSAVVDGTQGGTSIRILQIKHNGNDEDQVLQLFGISAAAPFRYNIITNGPETTKPVRISNQSIAVSSTRQAWHSHLSQAQGKIPNSRRMSSTRCECHLPNSAPQR